MILADLFDKLLTEEYSYPTIMHEMAEQANACSAARLFLDGFFEKGRKAICCGEFVDDEHRAVFVVARNFDFPG